MMPECRHGASTLRASSNRAENVIAGNADALSALPSSVSAPMARSLATAACTAAPGARTASIQSANVAAPVACVDRSADGTTDRVERFDHA